MDGPSDVYANTLVEYCSKLIVANWENRKYRGELLKRLHTANVDMVEYVLNMFRLQNKLSEGTLCQFLPSVCYSLNLTGCTYLRNSVLRQISFYGKNLKHLILDNCKQLSNHSLQSILQNCWELEILSIRGCFLITDVPFVTSSSLFVGLHALLAIRKLCLSRCSQLTGEFADSILKNCSKLRSLDISYCRNISQDALQKLFTLDYSELDIGFIPAVNDESFCTLLYHSEFIRILRMEHTNVTDSTLAEFIHHTPLLQQINIGNSAGIGDQTLLSLATNTPHLSVLRIDNNSMITDYGLGSVLTSCPITILSVAFCCKITDDSFQSINNTTILQEVNVMWCDKLTDATFQRLQNCSKLTRIGVKGCHISQPIIHQCERNGLTIF